MRKTKSTLVTGGEDLKNTLETGGEDVKKYTRNECRTSKYKKLLPHIVIILHSTSRGVGPPFVMMIMIVRFGLSVVFGFILDCITAATLGKIHSKRVGKR